MGVTTFIHNSGGIQGWGSNHDSGVARDATILNDSTGPQGSTKLNRRDLGSFVFVSGQDQTGWCSRT